MYYQVSIVLISFIVVAKCDFLRTCKPYHNPYPEPPTPIVYNPTTESTETTTEEPETTTEGEGYPEPEQPYDHDWPPYEPPPHDHPRPYNHSKCDRCGPKCLGKHCHSPISTFFIYYPF